MLLAPQMMPANIRSASAGAFCYFTNSSLALKQPASPQLPNAGVFVGDDSGGAATYLLNGQGFQRRLTKRDTSLDGQYLLYDETPGNRTWAFQIQPQNGDWAVFFQDDGGQITPFQLATKVPI